MDHWEPNSFVEAQKKYEAEMGSAPNSFQNAMHGVLLISTFAMIAMGAYISADSNIDAQTRQQSSTVTLVMIVAGFSSIASFVKNFIKVKPGDAIAKMPFDKIVEKCSQPLGANGSKVDVEDMFIGGSGSPKAVDGVVVDQETINAKYVVNCAGGASDKIAQLIGDNSFQIKPRLGDYLLLNRNQVSQSLEDYAFFFITYSQKLTKLLFCFTGSFN